MSVTISIANNSKNTLLFQKIYVTHTYHLLCNTINILDMIITYFVKYYTYESHLSSHDHLDILYAQ